MSKQINALITEVLVHGEVVDDPEDNPAKARLLTSGLHQSAKAAGITIGTKVMWVDDVQERLLVVWRKA